MRTRGDTLLVARATGCLMAKVTRATKLSEKVAQLCCVCDIGQVAVDLLLRQTAGVDGLRAT